MQAKVDAHKELRARESRDNDGSRREGGVLSSGGGGRRSCAPLMRYDSQQLRCKMALCVFKKTLVHEGLCNKLLDIGHFPLGSRQLLEEG